VNGRAVIGIVCIAAAALLWIFTPGHVTWGNHHYARHFVIYGLVAVGGIFVLVGAKRG
jgi:hypothetical protein